MPVVVLPMLLQGDEPAQRWYGVRWTPPAPGLLFYRFDAVDETDNRRSIMKNAMGQGVWGADAREHWQLTVHSGSMSEDLLAGGIMYQIFPDRFHLSQSSKTDVPSDRRLRSDWGEMPEWETAPGRPCRSDYFQGDLKGICQKLELLSSLGVTAIYLNPIFLAHSSHRYNTADYLRVDPLLGNEEDFARLCDEAKKLGMAVLLDGVFSHTGSDSIYFNREGRYRGGAYSDPASPYRRWYKFDDSPAGYKSWWGIETLPEVDEQEPSYIKFIAGDGGVIDHWMGLGASGWRLDVADELPDPALDAICAAIKRNNPQAPIVGEVWEDASNKTSYGKSRRYLLGNQLTSVTNYPLAEAIISFVRDGDVSSLTDTILAQQLNYPAAVRNCLMNLLSSHDTVRVLTALVKPSPAGASRKWQFDNNDMSASEYQSAKQLFFLAAVLQYMLPGVPCLYYGDEAGLYGYKDPFNRGCYPWGGEDEQLLGFFRQLGAVRRSCPCLAKGDFSLVQQNEDVFSFIRSGNNQQLYVCVNRGKAERSVWLPPGMRWEQGKLLFGMAPSSGRLAPLGYLIMSFPWPSEMPSRP
jgi:cyclomaltodextrinase